STRWRRASITSFAARAMRSRRARHCRRSSRSIFEPQRHGGTKSGKGRFPSLRLWASVVQNGFSMILPKSNRLTPEQLNEVTSIVAEFGCKIQPIIGAVRTIYAIVGDERDELMINRLEGLDYVDRIDRIQSPFKLMDKRSDLATHRITIGGV